jgi:hypothetical protein
MNWEDEGVAGADTRILKMDGTYSIFSEGTALADSVLEFTLTKPGQAVHIEKRRDQTWFIYLLGNGNHTEKALLPPFVCTIITTFGIVTAV